MEIAITFSRQDQMLVHACTLLGIEKIIKENLVLVVFLILEYKALY